MLKEMSSKSKEDGKAEEELFSSFKCHSTKVIASKAGKIAELGELSSSLENKIEKLNALNAELASKEVSIKKDLEKNDETKREADSTRENSHKSFLSNEKEMTENLKTLSQALTSLQETAEKAASKESATALLAMSSNAELAALGRQLQMLQEPQETLQEATQRASKDFLRKGSASHDLALLQKGTPGNYESQSGGVLGVLTSTKDTYAKDLEALQQTEASQKEAFEKMQQTLLSEKKELTELLSITEASRSKASTEIETRKSQLKEAKANSITELDLKEQEEKTLSSKTAVFEKRKGLRSEEETAIAQAIAVLNSDSSFGTFTAMSAMPPSFLQLRSSGAQSSRQAIQFLRREAHSKSSTKLAHLAVLLRANPFGNVLGEIQKMQETILSEGKADQKKFDWCAAERAKSKESKTEKETQIGNFKAELLELKETLTGPVDGLEATLTKAEEDIKENQAGQQGAVTERASLFLKEELQKTIVDTKKAIAESKVQVTENKEMKLEAEKEKGSIEEYLEDIKPQCDFITKNLDQRKANRAGETESLEKAIELIKGTPAYKGLA
eukprot:Skav212480  [mRNA]  locus=scaffold385:420920:424584:- [translate_table: standard]